MERIEKSYKATAFSSGYLNLTASYKRWNIFSNQNLVVAEFLKLQSRKEISSYIIFCSFQICAYYAYRHSRNRTNLSFSSFRTNVVYFLSIHNNSETVKEEMSWYVVLCSKWADLSSSFAWQMVKLRLYMILSIASCNNF